MSIRSIVDIPPLIAAEVPTFIKTGVCIVPCTVSNSPLRACPSVLSRLNFPIFILSLLFYPVKLTVKLTLCKLIRYGSAVWTNYNVG